MCYRLINILQIPFQISLLYEERTAGKNKYFRINNSSLLYSSTNILHLSTPRWNKHNWFANKQTAENSKITKSLNKIYS